MTTARTKPQGIWLVKSIEEAKALADDDKDYVLQVCARPGIPATAIMTLSWVFRLPRHPKFT